MSNRDPYSDFVGDGSNHTTYSKRGALL